MKRGLGKVDVFGYQSGEKSGNSLGIFKEI